MVGAANAINLATAGVVGFTGTAFGATPVSQYNVLLGGATVSTIGQAAPAASGTVLTSNGVSADPSFQAVPSSFNPAATVQLYDEFNSGSTSTGGQLNWICSNFASGSIAGNSGHPGIMGNQATGGAATSVMAMSHASLGATGSFQLGGGAITMVWYFNIRALSTAAPRYTTRFGFGDTFTSSDQANGVYFEYSDNINSGQWVIKTANASARTTTNSATTVTTGWHKAQIDINAGATSITFTMDGVSLGTITTNIPTGSITPFYLVAAGAAITADINYIDLFTLTQTLTTPR